MADEIAIKVDGVSKTFKLPHERHGSIKTALINVGRGQKGYEKQHVLKNVSFEIKKGEFFGIVGRNGSGKSTLLKLLAGIYAPDKGSITINGKLTPFIELGVGFNPELSGRENVFLNGALLGFNRKEMLAMYKDIVEFAELENFMDQKLKNYSSGMQVRLAFSIAIRARGDILLLDEVLAVGDAAFQQKCYDYFRLLKKAQKTVVLVTHDMTSMEKYCDRAVLIDEGVIIEQGSSEDVAQRYNGLFTTSPVNIQSETTQKRWTSEEILGLEIIVASKGKIRKTVQHNDDLELQMVIESAREVHGCACGVNVLNKKGQVILAMGFGGLGEDELDIHSGQNTITFKINPNILQDGEYTIDVALEKRNGRSKPRLLHRELGAAHFRTIGVEKRKHAMISPDITTTVSQKILKQ